MKKGASSGEALKAKLNRSRKSLGFILSVFIRISLVLLILGISIWVAKYSSFPTFIEDLKYLITSPFRDIGASPKILYFPWPAFKVFLLKLVAGSIGLGAFLSFLLASKAQESMADESYAGDYRLITASELASDYDGWWERTREKFEDVNKGKDDFYTYNDLGAMTGDELLRAKYGDYFTVAKDRVIYPETLQKSHTGASGATRTGKTTFIINQLIQSRFYGHQNLILDYNGELYKKFGRPDVDKILCPFDRRTENYSLFNEPVIPDKIASGLVAHDINNPFFSDNGRKLLNSLMRLSNSHEELHNLILMDQAPLRELLLARGIDTGKLFENNETAGDVITTMQTNLGMLKYLNHWNPRGRPFSVAKWAKYGLRGDVFIIVPDSLIEALRPWMRLFFELAITGALERNPDEYNKPLQIFGDEIKQLGHLQSLEKAITNGAKYNLRLCLGWQTDGQLESVYGKETSSILGNMRSRSVFNPGNINQGVEDATRLLGYVDITEVYVSETHTDQGASVSISPQEKRKPIVSEAELKSLEELEYYFKLPFQRPVKLVAMPHKIKSINQAMDIEIPPELKLGGMA